MESSVITDARKPRLLSREATAAYLGTTTRTVDRLVGKGLLTPVRLPGLRRVLFDRAELDAFVDAGKAK
jgi:excisionase family DNA binding protein